MSKFILLKIKAGEEPSLLFTSRKGEGKGDKSKAPVSQLVNADGTSVIEIKTQHYLES